jgi:hypothetical protein
LAIFPILNNPQCIIRLTAQPKVDTKCTAPSLIPTANGNTVRSFSTHGQQSAAKGSSTTVSRSDIRLIQYLDSSALDLVWSGGGSDWLFPLSTSYPQSPSAKRLFEIVPVGGSLKQHLGLLIRAPSAVRGAAHNALWVRARTKG